ncbi:uncharacterized protein RCC_10733 [Ramularia collo-cygni]|uniref:Uncharacterized protein n=1 Tax=Ramularia collo-cygni TaxID=112498 RepID=A0A2D3VGA7_9PEZI|nr:uncharacterized protein RCC_10733 [Ramularia collo-cygni]CZT25005.1 uncharacterized protein RCC_10733 [Ramularia collo-cygni]
MPSLNCFRPLPLSPCLASSTTTSNSTSLDTHQLLHGQLPNVPSSQNGYIALRDTCSGHIEIASFTPVQITLGWCLKKQPDLPSVETLLTSIKPPCHAVQLSVSLGWSPIASDHGSSRAKGRRVAGNAQTLFEKN